MRYAWIVLVIPVIAWVVPFLEIFTPYFVLEIYADIDARVATITSHVTAGSHSTQAVSIAMTCLILPVSLSSFICPAPRAVDDGGNLLQEYIQSLRVYSDTLVWHAPVPSTFKAIQIIEPAVSAALDCGAGTILRKDSLVTYATPPNAENLSSIATLSRDLAASLHEVLIHIEIAVVRISFMQSTILSGLRHFDEGGIFGITLLLPATYQLDRVISLLEEAASDSTSHLIDAVNRAISVVLTISTTLGHFRQQTDIGRASRAHCNPLVPLFRAESIASSVLEDLAAFRDALRNGLDQPRSGIVHLHAGGTYPLGLVRAVASAYFGTLRKQLYFLRSIRRATESTVAE
ncbi:hypothetical protein C2E23DRAFT_882412 [Lenzites betulinus]|nr:hypothetical protein C2E23DRAFT_882412 [Lenzites betulinus]